MKFSLCSLALLSSVASGAEIRWTATGAVSSVTGSDFSSVGVAASDPVEIEMVYDSNTQAQGRSFIPFPNGSVAGRTWFVGAAGLEMQVKIDGNTWIGQMATIPTSTNVMESVCYDPTGGAEWFRVTLDDVRGGVFPSFPATGEPEAPSMVLEFNDATSPASLFEVGILPDNLSQVCEITSASGSVNTGSSVISFSIDPESVRITLPPVPASLAKLDDTIQIRWETEIGKTYRVEATSDLKVWSAEGIYGGTGITREANFTPFGIYTKRFYRVVER